MLLPEDEVSIRRISHLAIAADGSRVVYAVDEADLVRNNRVTRLWLQSTGGGAARPLTSGYGSQRLALWSPTGDRVAFVGSGPKGDRLLVVDAEGGRPRDVLPNDVALIAAEVFNRPGGHPSFAWSPDGERIAFLRRFGPEITGDQSVEGPRVTGDPLVHTEIVELVRGGAAVRLCVINLASGQITELGGADRPLSAVAWSADGARISAVRRTAEVGGSFHFDLLSFPLNGGNATVVQTFDGAGFAPRFSPDGAWIAVSGAAGTTHAPSPFLRLYAVDGSARRELSVDDLTTYTDLAWLADGSALTAVADSGVERRIVKIDVTNGDITPLTDCHPWIEMASANASGDTIAFVGSAVDDPGDVFTLRLEGNPPVRLSEINPHLAALGLARGERMTWTAQDGTPLDGIVLYPTGFTPGSRAPFIIDYHGGPASHVTLGWSGPRQIFATAGYVVFAPNFRGGTGYGAAFSVALRGDLGGVPYTDSIDGVDHLLAEHAIDPNRLYAFGHSWGGFMTNWTATQTDRFKAIVSSGSICNLLSVYHTRYSADVWRWRLLGTPSESLDQYLKWSAILQADKVTTPVLFLNGAEDRTTPPTQGQEMFTALRQRGIPAEHVIYPREGHPTLEPAHAIDRYGRILDWFARYGGTVMQ
ncbi:MAG TPA: S9 family peptidase [Nitrolancea sp.]|nr:S9 family peptidase [Nitrolancea sp.]